MKLMYWVLLFALTLYLATSFRLRGETDVRNAYKIYRLSPLGFAFSAVYDGSGVPGSFQSFLGYGFTRDARVLVDAQPVPVVDVSPTRLDIQITWEFVPENKPIDVIVREDGNAFESLATGYVTSTIAPAFARLEPPGENHPVKSSHEDFRGLVTADDPAAPGEIVHVYLSGLGPVDRPVRTGEPSPNDPPARPLVAFACYASTGTRPAFRGVEVRFVGLAPGLVGVYQADIGLPLDLPSGMVTLRCEANGRTTEGTLPVR